MDWRSSCEAAGVIDGESLKVGICGAVVVLLRLSTGTIEAPKVVLFVEAIVDVCVQE